VGSPGEVAVLFGACLRQPVLNSASQLLLPLNVHERVVRRHIDIGMTCDFGSFDCATAHLLPPGYVCAAKGVWPESFEIAAFGSSRLVQRIAHAGVP